MLVARYFLLVCSLLTVKKSSRLEESYKKGVLKYSTKCTGKHLLWSLFYNKAASRRPLTSLNTETGASVFLWIFLNLYKNIYFVSACEGMPLINKIFTGVSFRKMLSFYYKRKRQFLYYEGTPSKTLKIFERVNSVVSQNSWVVACESTWEDKNLFKVNKKRLIQECYSGVYD